MLSLPAGVRIWLVAGFTDMRRGIDGLPALVQTALSSNPFSGELYISVRVKVVAVYFILWQTGFHTLRTPGSGSTRNKCPAPSLRCAFRRSCR